jgi:ABC-2 type transport system permease protein
VIGRWWVALGTTGREVLRGRLVLLLVALVPALFFAVAWLTSSTDPVVFQLGSIGDGEGVVRAPQLHEAAVFIGLAAVGVITSFIGLRLVQREVDASRRLVLCGYRASELVAARLAVLMGVVLAVATGVSLALPVVFFAPERPLPVWAAFVVMGWVYGCYGLLVGAVVRGELEGILFVALLSNLDSGWLQNPIWYADAQNREIIRLLPAHLPSQAAMGAAFGAEPVGAALLGGLGYGAGLLVLAAAVFSWRMRRR